MSATKFVNMDEIKAAIRDCEDDSLDTEHLIPHWAGDWVAEISDEELEGIMDCAHRSNSLRGNIHKPVDVMSEAEANRIQRRRHRRRRQSS